MSDKDIVEIYRFICDNFKRDDEVILLGFSRGAFVIRSVANMVCKLGFLNRVGLQKLPAIFEDYKQWLKWKSPAQYNEKKHLKAFTPASYRRSLNRKCMGKWSENEDDKVKNLPQEKRKLFGDMCKFSTDKDLENRHRQMAEAYRVMLEEASARCSYRPIISLICYQFGMILTKWSPDGNKREPVEGKIRAIGLWDTVGSLGIPKLPLFNLHRRNYHEMRFASLQIDPKVEYAFQALALDEYRTAFQPTMCCIPKNDNKTPKNDNKTVLRQVWFPGNHGDVGGGWADGQIATISLAWMADQLTSLGVEFSTPEMQRIFFADESTAEVRNWGMGKIHKSHGPTTWLDKIHNPIRLAKNCRRKPGMPEFGDGIGGGFETKESIHPSVRMRHLYDGKGPDDEEDWKCHALLTNGYRLQQKGAPAQLPLARPCRVDDALQPYRTILGDVTPCVNTFRIVDGQNATTDGQSATTDGQDATTDGQSATSKMDILVNTCRPLNTDLFGPQSGGDLWVWVKDNRTPQIELEEEVIGMWERMFIKINQALVRPGAQVPPRDSSYDGGLNEIRIWQ
ncbi:hypothetical protein FOMA001_g20263 [Fusarium oxysporum f. sp. matthiolae]|nr:hypothetical protein FOMA001_g20263 [Fusarium oxysporum f. sp. matthiolae]